MAVGGEPSNCRSAIGPWQAEAHTVVSLADTTAGRMNSNTAGKNIATDDADTDTK